MVMVTQYPDPVPDPADAKRPGGKGKAKRITKVAARPIGNPAKVTGAGQGRPRIRPRYSGR
jgi:hypothetical protein